MVQFAYNNNYHSSIGMASYEALNGRKCRSLQSWIEVGEKRVHDLDLVEIVSLGRKHLKIAFSRQKSYADPT